MPVSHMHAKWHKLPVPLSELCISTVLRCGQSFRWKSTGTDEWSCVLNGRILSLRQDPTHLHYRAIFREPPPSDKDDTVSLIRDYFNLNVNLADLYKKWSASDPNFRKKAPSFAGVRMLRQDPWENVVSFICSSNNNIARISQMANNLCLTFGPEIGELDGEPYFDFPEPSALTTPGVEQKLRELGFGYRAKYIANTAALIVNERPKGWLNGLRAVPYREAQNALLELPGVGPKVADCVCLMSLDKAEAVPVDTHVWQIARRDYKLGRMASKTLTKMTYDAIGDHFRNLWGKEAGWAHSVLFAADLKTFSDKLVKTEITTAVKTEMKEEAALNGEIVEEETTVKTEIKKEALLNGSIVKQETTVKTKRKTATIVKEEVEEEPLQNELNDTSLADRIKRRRRR